MTTWIKLGGKERPMRFTYDAGYKYEEETGGNWNETIFSVVLASERVKEALAAGDFLGVASAFSVKPISDLTFFALRYEHRKMGIEIDFEPEDVANWLFSDPPAMSACSAAIHAALPRVQDDDSTKKKPAESKKPEVLSASTGKG